jgi:hypothetical protein
MLLQNIHFAAGVSPAAYLMTNGFYFAELKEAEK